MRKVEKFVLNFSTFFLYSYRDDIGVKVSAYDAVVYGYRAFCYHMLRDKWDTEIDPVSIVFGRYKKRGEVHIELRHVLI